jgi:hypothetical protein
LEGNDRQVRTEGEVTGKLRNILISARESIGHFGLFCGPGFLIVGVHEGAARALGVQVGVVDGRAGLVG